MAAASAGSSAVSEGVGNPPSPTGSPVAENNDANTDAAAAATGGNSDSGESNTSTNGRRPRGE